jgi:hypothetical protein
VRVELAHDCPNAPLINERLKAFVRPALWRLRVAAHQEAKVPPIVDEVAIREDGVRLRELDVNKRHDSHQV